MSDSGRPSFPDRVSGAVRRLGWYALVWAVPPILSAIASYAAVQARSIVTEPRLKAALTMCVKIDGELPNAVCRLEDVVRTQGDAAKAFGALAKRMDDNDAEKFALRVRLGNEVRERVGVQVALHRALTYVIDPRKRDDVYDAQAAAKSSFDTFVLRVPSSPGADPVTEASEKVLREARVPR